MSAPPESTRHSLTYRLRRHAKEHWPDLPHLEVRFRSTFAYLDARLNDGTTLKLCRLRYGGSASRWGFAIYRASHDDYEESYLPSGMTAGTPEEALDCACNLYLTNATTWPNDSPTN